MGVIFRDRLGRQVRTGKRNAGETERPPSDLRKTTSTRRNSTRDTRLKFNYYAIKNVTRVRRSARSLRPRRGGTSFGDNRGDVLIITSAARTARNGSHDGAVIITEFTVTYERRRARELACV